MGVYQKGPDFYIDYYKNDKYKPRKIQQYHIKKLLNGGE